MWFEKNSDFPPFLPLLFEDILGESPSAALALSNEWSDFRKQSSEAWRSSREPAFASSIPDARKVVIFDEETLRLFLSRSNSGTVLMTIHMGDYLQACLQIFALIRNRRVIILRRHKPDPDELRMFQRIEKYGHQLEVVYHGHASVRKTIRALRAGAIVTILHDLSESWGRVVPVHAFNRTLNWASGPVEIAVRGRSMALPFHCFAENSVQSCQFGVARDYRSQHLKPSPDFIGQEVQHFVSQSAQVIGRFASQWHHWPLIPEMLADNT